MATKPDRWYFSREQLENSPSAKCGTEPERELSYRQQAANLIQDMGQRLQVFQLCINTAIVYMHRFYMFHSFTKFPRNSISAACLFLAAKVEEQPHKLEHVIRVAHACLHRGEPPLDPRSNAYAQQAQELVINESIILQTLGFEVGVVHPHTHVVKCTQMIRASKDLSQSSYFLATNSLHLTTFCLKYKPTVVACVCIHLACKWTQWTIPKSNDGKGWWEYVDPSVTESHLDELTREFLNIIDRCPARLKKRIMGYKTSNSAKDVKRPRSEGLSSTDSSQQAGNSTQVDSKASTSSSVYDFSFDSKPASGFDQYSDSEDSKSEEPASQKIEKAAPKVRVTIEEYKRKDRERKEKDTLAKQHSSAGDKLDTGGLGGSKALHKDFIKQGPKLLPGNIENIIISKERIPHGLEKLSTGQEPGHLSHERSHTGHERIPSSHEKRPSQDKHISGSKRTLPPHDKMHSGHTRGPSGPDRLSSTERSSGLEKPFSGHGKDHVRPLVHDQSSSSLGIRPQDKVAALALSSAKHSGSVKQKEQRRPDLHIPPSGGSSKEATSLNTERTLSGRPRDVIRKEHGQRSYAQALKTEKVEKEQNKHRSEQLRTLHPEKAVKERKPEPPKELPHLVKDEPEQEHATQGTLDLLNQISAEIMKDIENETTKAPDPHIANPVPIPHISKKEPRIAEDLMLKGKLQVPPSVPTSAKPVEKLRGESESDDIIADVISPLGAIIEERNDRHESKGERREERERKREERERRREGHRSKKDDKRHKSHKHRHRSPGSSHKQGFENDIDEGSGDMVPSKKQRLDQAGSTTVLTTSQGIKLKIKGLGNSFNNGSEHGRETEKINANCDSPGSVSLKLNLSKISSSPREPGKERDSNHHHHHHHRSHHKHKSRHSRSKDGHRKHSVSPGPSSASDASPAISPSKRKPVETYETATTLQNQSLLDLPMPPSMSKTSSHHASPITKHGKRKRESNPPLPNEDIPPPPPPPQSNFMLSASSRLPPMQFSTIDASALYDIQPPLPSGRPRDQRPPPPPPIPPPQRRPPLPP